MNLERWFICLFFGEGIVGVSVNICSTLTFHVFIFILCLTVFWERASEMYKIAISLRIPAILGTYFLLDPLGHLLTDVCRLAFMDGVVFQPT